MRKIPFLTLEKAKEIIEKIPTPFHIYDEAGIRANVRSLREAFSWNEGFREYFAVKATPNPYLLKLVHDRLIQNIANQFFGGTPGMTDAALLGQNQANIIKLDHNVYANVNRAAGVQVVCTLEAFGTEHKEQIIEALEKEGYCPKLEKTSNIYM